jgi:D-threonate/D-erythronate kinase
MLTPELGILADDLTGATDTGLQFAKYGRRTCVSLTWPVSVACDVLVVDLDSRGRSADDARDRAASASRSILAGGTRRLYQKIDSTGRGNLGAEIEGTLREYPVAGALVCPAFPELRRTVRDGQILVDGVPLDQTEFADDPLWPATTASLEAIIRRQCDWAIVTLGLADIRQGPTALRRSLRDQLRQGTRIVVADAETTADLRALAEALREFDARVLPVGSAGLAASLADSLERPVREARSLFLASGPRLVVAGTMNRVGLRQLARLVDAGSAFAALDLERALDDPLGAGDGITNEVIRHLWTAGCVVVSLVDPRGAPPDVRAAMESRDLTPAVVTERLVQGLARAAARAMDAVAPSALILTGGDTARAVCAALGAQALEISREAAPGVPISHFQGGRWDGLPVVTKAGGFGEPDTLVRVIQVLEAMRT